MEVTEVADPVAGEYEASVEMVACGLCNSTDQMLRRGTFPTGVKYPSVLGHESVGRVTAVGSKVRNFELGQLVTRCSAYSWTDPTLSMNWGGLAERGVVSDVRAWHEDHPTQPPRDPFPHVVFDGHQSPSDIALGISLAETWSVAANIGGLVGRSVVVSGTGIAGLSFVVYAKLLGARQVICVGRRAERLELAAQLGADDVCFTSEAERRVRALGGADLVFECSGSSDATGPALRWLREGGRVVIYSVSERPASINMTGLAKDAGLIVARPQEGEVLRSVVTLIERGVLDRDSFVSCQLDFDDVEKGFDRISSGEIVKAIVGFGATG
jgi:threonine dehydrogenase-like Zn-dependent dehydrogenase